MSKRISIKKLIETSDYIAQCGNNEKVFFKIIDDESNTVLARSENGFESLHDLYDSFPMDDGLIIYNNGYYEAFKTVKVPL